MASASSTHHEVHGMQAVMARAMPGIVGGLIGGVMFGILMQMMDMLPMVAQLVGSESIAVGWLVHLVISAGIGLGYAIVAGPMVKGVASGLVTGAISGAWSGGSSEASCSCRPSSA